MTTSYDTDPNSHTVAAAWASSPLGEAEREVRYGFATTGPTEQVTASEEEPTAKRVMVTAGLGCGIAAGALVGVMFFASTDSAQPTVVIPGSDAAGLSAPETAGAPSGSRLPGPPRALPGEPLPAPEGATTPNPVVRVPERVVVVPPAGGGRADVGSPTISAPGDTTVIVDIPVAIPPLPPTPPDPPDPLTPPDLPLAPIPELPPVLPDPPIPPLAPAPEVLAPLPAPGVELPVTPRIVDPPIESELPSSEPSFGPRVTDPDWDFSELSGP